MTSITTCDVCGDEIKKSPLLHTTIKHGHQTYDLCKKCSNKLTIKVNNLYNEFFNVSYQLE